MRKSLTTELQECVGDDYAAMLERRSAITNLEQGVLTLVPDLTVGQLLEPSLIEGEIIAINDRLNSGLQSVGPVTIAIREQSTPSNPLPRHRLHSVDSVFFEVFTGTLHAVIDPPLPDGSTFVPIKPQSLIVDKDRLALGARLEDSAMAALYAGGNWLLRHRAKLVRPK